MPKQSQQATDELAYVVEENVLDRRDNGGDAATATEN